MGRRVEILLFLVWQRWFSYWLQRVRFCQREIHESRQAKFMKIAVCSIAYNEADIIKACILNWKGKVDKHLVLVSSLPWNGAPVESDQTVEIARREGAEVIVGYWENEPMMRNWGLAYLYDYDYVLIVDPDELYTEADQQKILARLADPFDYINRVMSPMRCFRVARMKTYWKNSDYIFDPPDLHKPYIAVDPKQARFWNKRELMGFTKSPFNIERSELIDATIHHFSWMKTDAKVAEKIESYSHAQDIREGWYENVWLAWKPGSDMLLRPYGSVKGEESIAKLEPAPEEIKNLLGA